MHFTTLKYASWIYALAAVASLVVGIVFIGPAAMLNPAIFKEIALKSPHLLYLQDALKLILAFSSMFIYHYFYKYFTLTNTYLSLAYIMGILSAILLIINALLSIYAVFYQNDEHQAWISFLGFPSVFFNGLWFLIYSWHLTQTRMFSKAFRMLWVSIGITAILPVFAIFSLLLSIIWAFILPKFLARRN